jgi:hypothetical protein
MSTPESRTTQHGHISHTPNTIEYHTPANSEEGKKLAKSKVSTVIHTELKGPERAAHPITNTKEFGSHPDVHQVQHVVSAEERKISPEAKKAVAGHLQTAEKMLAKHDQSHQSGHEQTMRSYVNSTVTSGEKPSAEGYKAHLENIHNKKIEGVKTAKAKEAKTADKNAALAHVEKNKAAFQKSFDIHHHVQQATNVLARDLDKHGGGGFGTKIGGKQSGGEGYVANGLKVVDREGFSKANRERSAILRAGKKQ